MNHLMTHRGTCQTGPAMDRRRPGFDELFDAEFDNIFRYTSARLGRSDGEEVTADVFHAAARAFVDGKGDQVTGAWLMAVAKNKVIDRWRREERRRARAHLVWPTESDAVDPFPDHVQQAATRRTVIDVLEALSRRYRTLLIAHYVDEMSVPRIAELTGQSNRAVESALARARREFRHEFHAQEARP